MDIPTPFDLKFDEGHEKLVADLENLLIEAKNNEFHDFQNTKYSTPKMALVDKMQEIINKVKLGKYDN